MTIRSTQKNRKNKKMITSNDDNSVDELYFDEHNDLNNITNTYFNSLDILLSQPNNSRLMDIEDLISDTLNQYSTLIHCEVKKRLKTNT
jgi:accessory colonization factor AcfC